MGNGTYKQQFEAITHCPITKARMKYPVRAPDGILYEHTAYTGIPENKGKEVIPDLRLQERLQIFSRIENPTEADYQRFVEQDQTDDERKLLAAFGTFFNSLTRCPITGKIMKEPVITPDGICYEKTDLDAYLRNHHNKTPAGVEILPARKASVVIVNRKLQLKINEFLNNVKPVISNAALLGHYVTFFNDVAVDSFVSLTPFADPVVVAESTDNGGIQGLASWSALEDQRQYYDPVAQNRHPDSAVHHYQKIAYLSLQQEILTLKAALEQINFNAISQAHWDRLNDLKAYTCVEFVARDPADVSVTTLPVAPQRPVRRRITRRDLEPRFNVTTALVLGHLPRTFMLLPWYVLFTGYTRQSLSRSYAGFFLILASMATMLTVGGFLMPLSSLACYVAPQSDSPSRPAVVRGVAKRELMSYPFYFAIFYGLANAPYVHYIYYPIMMMSLKIASVLPSVAAAVIVPLMFFNFVGLLASALTWVNGESSRAVLNRQNNMPGAPQLAVNHPNIQVVQPPTTSPTYLFWRPAAEPQTQRVPTLPSARADMTTPLLSAN